MALQPQDDQNNRQNTPEYTTLETSQFSQNGTSNSVPKLKFSSITDIVNGPSPNLEDTNSNERDHSTASDSEDKLDELMKEAESCFGNLSSDERIDCLTKELDRMELKIIDESITDRIMSIETQPPTDIRRRYESDGKRQIEKSRSKPMTIKLPSLKNCKLNPDLSFWLELYLVTSEKNPAEKVYIHPYKLEYHEDDLPECDYGSARVPLTQDDIQKGTKELARIQIIKIKLDAYTFEFIPFNPLPKDTKVDIYENKDAKSVVAKAKRCRDLYNLQLSCIACKLLIKQNDIWLVTDIECKTDIMEEKKKSTKRSASCNISDDDEDEDEEHCRISAKKSKRSSSLNNALPITRVKKS